MRSVILIFCAFTPALAIAGGDAARILSVQGEAKWRPAGSADWNVGDRGDSIPEGATFMTPEGGGARLLMADKSILSLGANTNLIVTQYQVSKKRRRVTLKIAVGVIWARVTSIFGDNDYQIQTETAVAGVRGTDLFVVVDASGATEIGCLSGAVDVGLPGGPLRHRLGGLQQVKVSTDGDVKRGPLDAGAIRTVAKAVPSTGLGKSNQQQRIDAAGARLDSLPTPLPPARPTVRPLQQLEEQLQLQVAPTVDLEPSRSRGFLHGTLEVRKR